jgi:hypothetical protein
MTPARERAEHLHALALMGITTPDQTWLMGIDFPAWKEKWAAEDECGLCGGSFSDDAHAMLSGDCPTEYERKR